MSSHLQYLESIETDEILHRSGDCPKWSCLQEAMLSMIFCSFLFGFFFFFPQGLVFWINFPRKWNRVPKVSQLKIWIFWHEIRKTMFNKARKYFVGTWGLATRHDMDSYYEMIHNLPLKHMPKGPGLEFSIQSQTQGHGTCPVMKILFLRRIIYLALYTK